MGHISKRRKAFAKKVDHNKSYPALDAMKLVKDTATAKFDEAVEHVAGHGAVEGEAELRAGGAGLADRDGAAGVEAVTPPTDRPWGQRTAYVRDPDGHLVELAR
jgi:catechol 2,3-dioxygenase-like lactoylglutathione lyase family enzyme